uniref:Ovule protein n=1 Tax=Ascaris lumbricoides TaxID=6252 RepID=A0A0M3IWS7_ASCLU
LYSYKVLIDRTAHKFLFVCITHRFTTWTSHQFSQSLKKRFIAI